jgi:hypothetical protein
LRLEEIVVDQEKPERRQSFEVEAQALQKQLLLARKLR